MPGRQPPLLVEGASGAVLTLAQPFCGRSELRVGMEQAAVQGVWLRPFRNLVYAMPPFVAREDQVAAIARAMIAVARAA